MPTKPISPTEAAGLKLSNIPEEVIEEFNRLIAKSWNGHSSVVRQTEAADAVAQRMNLTRNIIFQNKWLDIENLYRQEGWRVEYDKPGYNETGEAFFTFTEIK